MHSAILDRLIKRALRTLCFSIVAAFSGLAISAHASPIYVYNTGRAITFSSRPPATGEAKVWTGRSAGFTTYRPGSYGSNYGTTSRLNTNRSFDQFIREASNEFGVDKSLIRAVIHAESGFNPRAISPKGALGLMQLMPSTARMHGVRKAMEPQENIRGGTRHLADLLKRYRGNLVYSIAAYNAGEGAVQQYGGIPPYAETKEYVRRVLALQSRYKNSVPG